MIWRQATARPPRSPGSSSRCRSGCATCGFSAASTWPHPRSWGCSSTQQARLDGTGRLLVRASGTEPLIRVMVEAEDEALLADVLDTVSRRITDLAQLAA